ncbi:hypothetical protein JCM10212_001512 [Sporobolomyces blumeae]
MRPVLAFAVLAIFAVLLTPVDAMKKKKIKKPRTFCPPNEVACPIMGSTTYGDAVRQHFEGNGTVMGIMAGDGGYECVNVKEALDSCGGCASTGEGKDCTKIRGASGVGCEGSRCVVFSCRPGWKVSMSGEACVRTKASRTPSTNEANGTTTKTTTSRLRRLAREHARRHARHGPRPPVSP